MTPEERKQQIDQIKKLMQTYGAFLPVEYQKTIQELIIELENPNGADQEKVSQLAGRLFGGSSR